MTIFDIQKDIEKDKALQKVRRNARREDIALTFDPDEWKRSGKELMVENYRLSQDELRSYALVATGIRS